MDASSGIFCLDVGPNDVVAAPPADAAPLVMYALIKGYGDGAFMSQLDTHIHDLARRFEPLTA